ncbi:MAG: heavy-metal-associated domain-containing protein [Bacteroidales bacterium]|nr:heavy-metal-associated domain-containing protein [Bacteroidales bacterium]
MKTKVLSLVSVLFFSTMSLFAQDKAEKIKVYGNCGMCETRIEKAVNAIDGVSAADWNKETKMLKVSFDESKTDIHKVHMAVAKVGHDTKKYKADDSVYNKLPSCCLYERLKL